MSSQVYVWVDVLKSGVSQVSAARQDAGIGELGTVWSIAVARGRVDECDEIRMLRTEVQLSTYTTVFWSFSMRRFRFLATVAFLLAVTATTSFAQTSRSPIVYHDSRKLGGATSFYLQRPLTDAASLKTMAETRDMENDIRRVLAEGGVRDARLVATDVVGVMKGGFCAQARAAVRRGNGR